jgi:hypothetical protein
MVTILRYKRKSFLNYINLSGHQPRLEDFLRALSFTVLALLSLNAFAASSESPETKLAKLIASTFDLKSEKVNVLPASRNHKNTIYLVNGVTECAVAISEKGEKEVECDDLVILDAKDIRSALGSDYDRL